jgi:hypothetical protein
MTFAVFPMLAYIIFCLLIFTLRWTGYGIFAAFFLASISNLGNCIFNFAYIFTGLGLVGPDGNVSTDSSTALYFSIITWTTVGYGDFRPTSDSRVFAAIEALLGTIFLSLFIAGIIHCANNFPIQPRSYDPMSRNV